MGVEYCSNCKDSVESPGYFLCEDCGEFVCDDCYEPSELCFEAQYFSTSTDDSYDCPNCKTKLKNSLELESILASISLLTKNKDKCDILLESLRKYCKKL